jgi:hypothetical protein
MFRANMLLPFSGMKWPKMEAVYSSETLVSTYKFKRRYNLDDQN